MIFFPSLSFPWSDSNAPDDYVAMAFTTSPELSVTASRIHWEFHDLVVAYDMLRQTLIGRDRLIQERMDEPKEREDTVADELNELMEARFRETLRAENMMMAQISRTSTRSIIVNSWILVESTMGEAYSAFSSALNGASPNPTSFRWEQFLSQFGAIGISLTDLSGYENANLCRLVNNAIKHAGKVSETMSQSAQFAGLKGQELRNVDVSPQPLVTGAYSFCMDLLERVQVKVHMQQHN